MLILKAKTTPSFKQLPFPSEERPNAWQYWRLLLLHRNEEVFQKLAESVDVQESS